MLNFALGLSTSYFSILILLPSSHGFWRSVDLAFRPGATHATRVAPSSRTDLPGDILKGRVCYGEWVVSRPYVGKKKCHKPSPSHHHFYVV